MFPTNTISIAMCTYNGEAFLKAQLESIQSQTILPSELVVCDDCSSDATLEILHAFREGCKFPVKIIPNAETLWVTRNFEKVISHCSGDIIVLSDQDDIWQPYKLEKMLQAFRNDPGCGYVFSNADLVDEGGKSLNLDLWQLRGFNDTLSGKYESGAQLEVMLGNHNLIFGMTMAFRSAYLPSLLPFDSRAFGCAHDTWIALLLSAKGAYGVAMRESLVNYRQHERQITGAGGRVRFVDTIRNMVATVIGKRATAGENEEKLALAQAMENVAARLQREDASTQHALYAIKLLSDKSVHLKARALANSSRGYKKLKLVLREAMSGRYRRYSGSCRFIIKDMLSCS